MQTEQKRRKKRKRKKRIFWYPAHKKIQPKTATKQEITTARAVWPKRLGLVPATPWADLVVIGDQLWSTIIAIFPCVALSWKNCSLLQIFAKYCQPKKKPTLWNWVHLPENLVISTTNIDFWYQRIVQSWFASIPSVHPWVTKIIQSTLLLHTPEVLIPARHCPPQTAARGESGKGSETRQKCGDETSQQARPKKECNSGAWVSRKKTRQQSWPCQSSVALLWVLLAHSALGLWQVRYD